jgi:hypothetical protein
MGVSSSVRKCHALIRIACYALPFSIPLKETISGMVFNDPSSFIPHHCLQSV